MSACQCRHTSSTPAPDTLFRVLFSSEHRSPSLFLVQILILLLGLFNFLGLLLTDKNELLLFVDLCIFFLFAVINLLYVFLRIHAEEYQDEVEGMQKEIMHVLLKCFHEQENHEQSLAYVLDLQRESLHFLRDAESRRKRSGRKQTRLLLEQSSPSLEEEEVPQTYDTQELAPEEFHEID